MSQASPVRETQSTGRAQLLAVTMRAVGLVAVVGLQVRQLALAAGASVGEWYSRLLLAALFAVELLAWSVTLGLRSA